MFCILSLSSFDRRSGQVSLLGREEKASDLFLRALGTVFTEGFWGSEEMSASQRSCIP